jgi:hypothetical protein
MTTKAEHFQNVWHAYIREKGGEPAELRDLAKWAVSKGHADIPKIDPYDVLADDFARALRSETRTDSSGRTYRMNHAARKRDGGGQRTFWATIDYAPRPHMEMAFAQRRNQIVGECIQLKTDVDVFNQRHPTEPKVQLSLNFEDDVAEEEALRAEEARNSNMPDDPQPGL